MVEAEERKIKEREEAARKLAAQHHKDDKPEPKKGSKKDWTPRLDSWSDAVQFDINKTRPGISGHDFHFQQAALNITTQFA